MTRSVQKRLTVAALVLSASVLLSRILGFIRDAVIAYLLGAGSETDAYFAAFTLPDLMNYFLAGGALSITFIPLYSRYLARDDRAGADRLASTVLTNMGLILVVLIVVGELFAPQLVAVLFPGFDAPQVARTTELTRIVMPAQLFFYCGGVLSAVLMAQERFVAVALVPLVYNLSIIVFGLVLYPFMDVGGFSVGALVGAFLGPLLIPLIDVRTRFHFRPRAAFRDAAFIGYLKLTLPLMLGVTLLTADEWLGRYFASGLEEGTITWLNNARRLMLVPMALIGQAAGQAALPFLSRLVGEGRDDEMRRVLSGTLRVALFLSTVCAAFVAVYAQPIVTAVFMRGRYSVADTLATATILQCYCPAIIAWTVQVVAVRGFYSHTDTIRPMVIGTIVTSLSLPLYWALCQGMAAPGLALATSAGVSLNAIATVAVLSRRYGSIDMGSVMRGSGRGLLTAATAAAPLVLLRWGVDRLVGGPSALAAWFELALAGALFAGLVLVVAHRLGGPEAALIDRIVNKLLRRR